MKQRKLLTALSLALLLLFQATTPTGTVAQTTISIYDIQYTTDPSGDSPYEGDTVTTEGVVSAVDGEGYFIQDRQGGAWNGVYVYDDTVPSIGDEVKITGEVSEYYGLTELKDIARLETKSTGNGVPTVELSASEAMTEAYEGVLVATYAVTVTSEANSYGEWEISDASGSANVDDLFYGYAPALGENLTMVRGPVYYSYGTYRIEPRSAADIVGAEEFTVYDIQYPGGDSPELGNTVTVTGTVVGVYEYGYVVEHPSGGPWSGVYVYDAAHSPALGDLVTLTGDVSEYYDLTQVGNVSDFSVVSSGNALPTPEGVSTEWVATGSPRAESYEGVLVATDVVTVTDDDLGYGEWEITDVSGTGARVDDMAGYSYSPADGDTWHSVQGVLWYSFGDYKIEPRSDADLRAAVRNVYINEIRIDQPGGDSDEYFELAGEADTALDGLTYLVIGDGAGGSGVIEAVVDLSGQTVSTEGYFVAAESSFSSTLGTADLTTDLNFENSDNVTHLLVSGFSGSGGDDLDTDDDGVLDTDPWSEVLDCVALVEDLSSGEEIYCPTTVGPDGEYVPGHVFFCPDGWQIGAFDPEGGDDTPGAFNNCIGKCGDLATLISAVQGEGFTSPLIGTPVVIEGIVVGDFQDNESADSGDLGGFYVQEEDSDADGNALTSEGVFVYDDDFGVDVAPGDRVRVFGVASEYSDLTEIGSVGEVLVCDSGNSVTPASVTLPVTSTDDLEAYEGMSVLMTQPLFISEFYNFDHYGEIVLTTDRQFQPTAIYDPDSPERAELAEENRLNRIQLEDGRTTSYPDPAIHPNGMPFTLTNRFRGGDVVENVRGVMSYSHGEYEIQPTAGADYTAVNERSDAPQVTGEIKAASFNVLNYFTTLDDHGWVCGPNSGQECRGADNAEEFARQQAKIVAAMCAIDADVFGLMELENQNPANDPEPGDGIENYVLQSLVEALNDPDSPCPDKTYSFTDSPATGTDAIRQGIIYKSSTVTPVGSKAVLTDTAFTDPNGLGDQKNRPAIAETFEDADGERFTVAVNHLKSKGSGCGAGDDDPIQGNCNGTRTEGAEYLVDWLATDPTGSGDADVLILGDLNAYDKEDPIDALVSEGYTDLLGQYQGEYAYSYVFDGQLGYLDYGMANEDLLPQVSSAVAWHINADEPDILDYDMSEKEDAQDALYEANPYRSSDHDPVIVGLRLSERPFRIYLPLVSKAGGD